MNTRQHYDQAEHEHGAAMDSNYAHVELPDDTGRRWFATRTAHRVLERHYADCSAAGLEPEIELSGSSALVRIGPLMGIGWAIRCDGTGSYWGEDYDADPPRPPIAGPDVKELGQLVGAISCDPIASDFVR